MCVRLLYYLRQSLKEHDLTIATISVEERLGRIEARLDTLTTVFVTKEDLANFKADLSRDMIRLTLALATLQLVSVGTVAAIVKFIW